MKKVSLNNEENIINFLKNKTINKDEKSNYISAILSSDLINLNIMDIFLENNLKKGYKNIHENDLYHDLLKLPDNFIDFLKNR